MPKFRKPKFPADQARAVVGRLVNLGALRRNPSRPASVRTVANYRECLERTARHIAGDGLELRDLTPETAADYLRSRADDLGQKSLDMHRQALQAMLVHVSRRLAPHERIEVVKTRKTEHRKGRAYTAAQVALIVAAQSPKHALATEIAYAAGLRAHELLTLARLDEQPPHVRPAREEKFASLPGIDYTVAGKGGLVRVVRLPADLAERLEARRRPVPVRVTDRAVHYPSRYDVGGGRLWSSSFSSASMRALGWSTGAHGLRHAYAQERMAGFRRSLDYEDARETVSQELGHFRPGITETYLR